MSCHSKNEPLTDGLIKWGGGVQYAVRLQGQKYQTQVIQAKLFRTKTVETARADGEKIRLIGAAEARAIEAVGR